MKKGFKIRIRSIRLKFMIPILLVILMTSVVMGVFFYERQRQTLTDIMKQTTSQSVQNVNDMIRERQETMDVLKQALNKYLIDITKGVAESLKAVPDDQLDAEAVRLAESLGVDEIHIIDENGILQWGNVPEVYGFDFNSSDQTKPFLEGLTNKDFALAQDPQPRGVDQQLFQYITVARIDKPGLVQIGVTPEDMQALMNKVNIQEISLETKVGKNGYVFIADKDGKIVSYPDQNQIGKALTDFSWGSKINQLTGSFVYSEDGIEKLLTYQKAGDFFIAATIPTSEYYGQLLPLKTFVFFMINVSVILSGLIIYFISNILIIKRIKSTLTGMKQIGSGNLNISLKDKGNDEISQLAAGLNSMADNLKIIVNQIDSSADKLGQTAQSVAQASEQTSVASQEIAQSINQIAIGTSDQAQEVANSVEQLGIVSQNIHDIIDNTKIMSEKVSIIEKQSNESISTVDALKEKFTENKDATAKAMEIISLLAEKSSKISAITGTITNINKQTNLLALNASIEAARAGESGKGFAVVANEVKTLATQSAKAALGIGELISEISLDIEDAVKSINSATKAVGESDLKLINTMESFQALKESNDVLIDLSKKMNDICIILNDNTNKAVESLDTIAAVSEETAATTEEISASTEEQTASFEEINEGVNGVKELSKELVEMISRFKTE